MSADPFSTISTLAERRRWRIDAAFANEAQAGVRLAAQAKLAAVSIIAFWILVNFNAPAGYYDILTLSGFAITGLLQLHLARARLHRAWFKYAFMSLDILLLTYLITVPNPLRVHDLPVAMELREASFANYFLLLPLAALSYSPGFVLWTGFTAALARGVGVAWILMQPGTIGGLAPPPGLSADEILARRLDTHFVDLLVVIYEILVYLVATGMLTAVVARVRKLVQRQAIAERARGNLARYFSPNLVDELTDTDQALGTGRAQNVVVLFTDIVGFTGLTATIPPAKTMELLRKFFGRLEDEVFRQGGTIDKFIGDGLMATFGTLKPAPDDPLRALRCAKGIVRAVQAWNEQRLQQGEPPIRIGVGAHYGPVVVGDVGGERRVEFTVVGDTVNVASRLEKLTRALQADIAVSADLLAAARTLPDSAADLAGFFDCGDRLLPGREQAIGVWSLSLGRAASPAARPKLRAES